MRKKSDSLIVPMKRVMTVEGRGGHINRFFDNVNHEWLMKFLEHDIQDKNFLRYIVRFLKAGIMEGTQRIESDRGTPQGGKTTRPVL